MAPRAVCEVDRWVYSLELLVLHSDSGLDVAEADLPIELISMESKEIPQNSSAL